MSDDERRLIILGPQPVYRSLSMAFDRLGISGSVALITAGWEVDEPEDIPVKNAIPLNVYNLELFKRSEQLFNEDRELIGRLRDRQDELRFLRDAYRIRLDLALQAARHLIKQDSEVEYDLGPEVESAIEQVRQLDQQYLQRTSQICEAYERELDTANRKPVAEHREQLRQVLDQTAAIIISGGHAAIILNRLRIFGILDLAPSLPVVAWSGGAMALADQVVFFHDSPPQGPGNPEVLRAGMGLLPDLLPLPNASRRLNLDDTNRVELFARRFLGHQCVELNESTLLDYHGGSWKEVAHCRQLSASGKLTVLAP